MAGGTLIDLTPCPPLPAPCGGASRGEGELPESVKVAAHNESRVIAKLNGAWKVVHVHKSPAYPAPHVREEGKAA